MHIRRHLGKLVGSDGEHGGDFLVLSVADSNPVFPQVFLIPQAASSFAQSILKKLKFKVQFPQESEKESHPRHLLARASRTLQDPNTALSMSPGMTKMLKSNLRRQETLAR